MRNALPIAFIFLFPFTLSAWKAEEQYTVVSPVAPIGMELPDYSVMVTYSWKFSDANQRSQIESWGNTVDRMLADSETGFRFVTHSEPGSIQHFFYVSELEQFRILSIKSGELLVDAEIDYAFSRDLEWSTWDLFRADHSERLRLALLSEE